MLRHIIVLPDGTELTSGTGVENAIMAVKCTESVNVGQELTPGSAFSNILEATVLNPGGGLNVNAGDEVTVYKVDDSGTRTLYGVFVMEKPTRPTANTMKLTGYDRIVKLDKDLTDWVSGLTFPFALIQFARMVCEECGLELLVSNLLPNEDFAVYRFAKKGVTGRQIMRWLGEICCRFCRATPDGKIEFAWYKPAGREITPTGKDYYFAGSLKYDDYHVMPVDMVKVRLGEGKGGVLWPNVEAENPYIISGNAVLLSRASTSSLRPYLQVIEDELSAMTYTPCKVSVPATLAIRAGDWVEITDGNGQKRRCLVMTKTTSGQRDTLECTGSYRRDSADAVNNKGMNEIAQEKADEAEKNALTAAEQIAQAKVDAQTQLDIFNKLTDNGKLQGIYIQDGKWYINAELAQIVNLFTQNIFMSGMFLGSGKAFFEPGWQELETLYGIMTRVQPPTAEELRLFDFNSDGAINVGDYQLGYNAFVGKSSLANWSGAKKSDISVYILPSDPQKAVRITGTNMWGRAVEVTLGTGSLFNGADTERNFNLLLTQSQAFTELKARVDALENT